MSLKNSTASKIYNKLTTQKCYQWLVRKAFAHNLQTTDKNISYNL